MSIKGILGAAISLILLTGATYAAGTLYLESAARERAEIIIGDLRKRGATVTYAGIDSALLSSGLSIRDVRIVTPTKQTYRIRSIDVRNFDWQNPEQPRHVDIRLNGVAVDPSGLAMLPKEFRDLFGGDTRFDFDVQHRYDPQTRTIELKKFTLSGEKLGTLTLSFKIGNFTMPQGQLMQNGQPSPMVLMQLFAGGTTFDGAAVRFSDSGLVDRLFKAYAAKEGEEEAKVKADMIRSLRRERRRVKFAIQRELIDALIGFIQKPGTIAIVSKPPQPIPVGRFISRFAANPDGVKSMLGLTIERQ